VILIFSKFSQNYLCIGNAMDHAYGSRYHGWLLIHGRLVTMGRHNCSVVAQEVFVIARREGEEVVGFSPMVPLGCGTTEIATRWRSTEVGGGAPMGR
jgi:hypothetical protein